MMPNDSGAPAVELGPAFLASECASDGKHHVLVAASGSVATIKLPEILRALSRGHGSRISMRVILTASARNFLLGQSAEQPSLRALRAYDSVDGIYVDEDEWRTPWTRGAGILHIELRRWAHCLLIAPLSANTLAKLTAGICDNLLLSVVRAWDATRGQQRAGGQQSGGAPDVPSDAPSALRQQTSAAATLLQAPPRIFVAPAMNTCMWEHPLTARQLAVLEGEWGYREDGDGAGQGASAAASAAAAAATAAGPQGWFTVIRPMEKTLACGDVGAGAMEDWRVIVGVVSAYLSRLPSA
ncbi:hypothetical protein KEM52_001658 [Ascosphaera acerosa]|nr:hypothetical protein KEM52_001658 [Ascosphaera acerosa]